MPSLPEVPIRHRRRPRIETPTAVAGDRPRDKRVLAQSRPSLATHARSMSCDSGPARRANDVAAANYSMRGLRQLTTCEDAIHAPVTNLERTIVCALAAALVADIRADGRRDAE